MTSSSGPFADVRAVVFDYGNTVVPFGPMEIRRCDHALVLELVHLFGQVDMDRVRIIRDRDRRMPYAGNPPAYRENDLAGITRDLVRDLYGRPPDAYELDVLLRARFTAFVQAIELPEDSQAVLEHLRATRRLGLLSNYPDGSAIRASLDKIGLANTFDAVVVSGDLGVVKPHPAMFATMLEHLGVDASEVLLVGDNWLADVQGGKRAGWRVAHMTRWDPPEYFAPSEEDARPDVVIGCLTELPAMLA
jgi:HAD superfamily hydrolase (TIGR01509 family)